MYGIGESILYGSGGVMTVVDIREEKIVGDVRAYYVLRPYGAHSSALTYVPTDSDKLTAMMHPLLTEAEALALLDSVANLRPIEWIADNRRRADCFKDILESGDREKIVSMILAIELAGERREVIGKKNFLSDENAMKKAEKLIFTELSVVLGISEDEVRARFLQAKSVCEK